FNQSGTSPASAFSATVNFGDGTAATPATVLQVGNGFQVVANHTFPAAGTFTFTVAVTDPAGHVPQVQGAAAVGPTTRSANRRWLTRVYGDLFGRAVDPTGMGFWLGRLSQGASRAQVALEIEGSVEYRTVVVQGLYGQFLGRAADAFGLNTFVTFLGAGG